MSLFGVLAPKMIVNIDTTQDTIDLNYSVVLQDEPILNTYSVQAVRTGKQVLTNAGKHWLFKIKINLWKYAANAEAKYLELKSYEGLKIYLYRHNDGNMFVDIYDNPAEFVITSVDEDYIERVNFKDILTITFESVNYIKSL